MGRRGRGVLGKNSSEHPPWDSRFLKVGRGKEWETFQAETFASMLRPHHSRRTQGPVGVAEVSKDTWEVSGAECRGVKYKVVITAPA